MKFNDYLSKIEEALENKKIQANYKSSSLDDPQIKSVIAKFSQESGIPQDKILEEINKEIEKAQDLSKYSPKYLNTMMLNIVEESLFTLIWKNRQDISRTDPSYQFSPAIFSKLIKYIDKEHRKRYNIEQSLFPLKAQRGEDDFRHIGTLNPILVPTVLPEYKKYNNVKTAAATATGDFIFNVKFMDSLLYYGSLIGIGPNKGPAKNKYVSNGGDIPDNYCYLEFLILHEIFHYVFGDFAYGRRFKQYDNRVHNIASDLRSNHILVRGGYVQLPLGLYSNDLNLDKEETKNYSKLIKEVKKELDKLPKQMQAWIEEKVADDHTTSAPSQKEKWVPKPGEIVINKDRFVQIISVDEQSGKVVAREISEEEVKKIYPNIKINR